MPYHGQYQHVKEWLQDHDTDFLEEIPPVQNTWYEVFHAEDVRLLICIIRQKNDEVAAKQIECRWTIDGTEYLTSVSQVDNTLHYWYRGHLPSAGGTAGLLASTTLFNAARYVDKRGLDFKVEVRMTGVPGTNQELQCWCVRETLEVT